jgi:hypothetical protein
MFSIMPIPYRCADRPRNREIWGLFNANILTVANMAQPGFILFSARSKEVADFPSFSITTDN